MKLLQVLALAIILNIVYTYSLKSLNGKSFKVFNYKIVIHRCGPRIYDRITKIEKKVKSK